MTSFSGLKLPFDVAHRLGILKELKNLTVKKRQRGIEISDFVMSLVGNFLVGGEHFSDLSVLRSEGATKRQLYDLEVPAPTTAGETLRKFSLGHIKQLEKVIHSASERANDIIGGDESITMDLDSSIYEVHGYFKEGAKYGYSGVKGYHPLLCFWSENRTLVGTRLRSGNSPSARNANSFISECLGRIPRNRKVRWRLDAGFYNKNVARHLFKLEQQFTISAYLTQSLKAKIEALPKDVWKPYPWQEEAQWTEIEYRPTQWPCSVRLLVKKVPRYDGDQATLDSIHYSPIVTNRQGCGSSLLKFHFNRGGAENYIEEFKNGIGTRITPSRNFAANYAWFVIAQLAYNLAQWFKLLVLPKSEHSRQLKALRLHWFCVGARIIRTARKTVFALARGPTQVAQFQQAAATIAAL